MVSKSTFGKSKEYTINNGALKAVFLDYGAGLIELYYEGKNVCLGYDRFEDFEKSEVYVGTTVGCFTNRITGAKFTLDSKKDSPTHKNFPSAVLRRSDVLKSTARFISTKK